MKRNISTMLALTALVGACGEAPPVGYPGYVEADYVRVAAPLSGTLAKLSVKKGDLITALAPLFVLESAQEAAARAEAEARVRKAQAALADLEKARRPPEIAAVRAQVLQAQASLRQSEADLERARKLVAEKFLPPQKLDEALAKRDGDRARVAELSAQVTLANLPARADEIGAARAEVKAASDALAQAQWRVDQKTQTAPAGGVVNDTYYREGEWVGAGAPVVSLLPPSNVKIRFYVPEPQLSTLRMGAPVTVRCDGCAQSVAAKVSFIAPQAEYTPPVIYSRENRAKLVFLVEARPDAANAALHPGLPVEVAVASTERP